jgi:reactive intermediate/imine deaminase
MRTTASLLLSWFVAAGVAFAADRQVIRVGADLGLPFSPAIKAGGFIYVSGTLAIDDSGKVIQGDIKAQTRRVLQNIGAILKAAGSGHESVASANVYLKDAADFAAMNEVYKEFFPKDPPVRTTVITGFVLPGAIVEISAVAVPTGSPRRVIHPEGWVKSPNPYSYGVMCGDTMFLSGLVSRNGVDNAPVSGDIKVQTRKVLENASEILKAGGMSLADAVASRVYITDTAMFQDMNAVYRGFFPKDPPARATVRTGLAGTGFNVEITLTAAKGGTKAAFTTPNADGTPGGANPNFSSAIRVGNRLWVAGMMGLTDSNKGNMPLQSQEALVRIERTLRAAGFDWKDVAEAVVYVTDVSRFAEMNAAYRAIFARDFPARATVETGLVSPDGVVEIMFTAVK